MDIRHMDDAAQLATGVAAAVTAASAWYLFSGAAQPKKKKKKKRKNKVSHPVNGMSAPPPGRAGEARPATPIRARTPPRVQPSEGLPQRAASPLAGDESPALEQIERFGREFAAATDGAPARAPASTPRERQDPGQHVEPRASSPFVSRLDGSPRRPSDIRGGRADVAAKEEQLRSPTPEPGSPRPGAPSLALADIEERILKLTADPAVRRAAQARQLMLASDSDSETSNADVTPPRKTAEAATPVAKPTQLSVAQPRRVVEMAASESDSEASDADVSQPIKKAGYPPPAPLPPPPPSSPPSTLVGGAELDLGEIKRGALMRDIQRQKSQTKAEEIFRHFDRDANERLDRSEYLAFVRQVGGDVDEEIFKEACAEVGATVDEGISMQQFVDFYLNPSIDTDLDEDYKCVFEAAERRVAGPSAPAEDPPRAPPPPPPSSPPSTLVGGAELDLGEIKRGALMRDIQRQKSQTKAEEIFRHFDRDANERLDRSEYLAFVRQVGGDVDEEIFKEACAEVGATVDEGISMQQFVDFYLNPSIDTDLDEDYKCVFEAAEQPEPQPEPQPESEPKDAATATRTLDAVARTLDAVADAAAGTEVSLTAKDAELEQLKAAHRAELSEVRELMQELRAAKAEAAKQAQLQLQLAAQREAEREASYSAELARLKEQLIKEAALAVKTSHAEDTRLQMLADEMAPQQPNPEPEPEQEPPHFNALSARSPKLSPRERTVPQLITADPPSSDSSPAALQPANDSVDAVGASAAEIEVRLLQRANEAQLREAAQQQLSSQIEAQLSSSPLSATQVRCIP